MILHVAAESLHNYPHRRKRLNKSTKFNPKLNQRQKKSKNKSNNNHNSHIQVIF